MVREGGNTIARASFSSSQTDHVPTGRLSAQGRAQPKARDPFVSGAARQPCRSPENESHWFFCCCFSTSSSAVLLPRHTLLLTPESAIAASMRSPAHEEGEPASPLVRRH